MLLAALLMAAPAPALHFDLAPARPVAGRIAVPADKVYETGGWGYESDRRGGDFLFSAAVPEGNYKVTVRFSGNITVKAESRRLMLSRTTHRGSFENASFFVNVRNAALAAPPENAPGGTRVLLKPREAEGYTWDDKLTLEFLGDARVASIDIEPVEVPTVYLAGDSTVTDQRYEPAASWGQMLPALFGPGVAIANHAESGETLKSFTAELRLAKMLSGMKAGDWLLIQFGHNDQKEQWPQTYADPEIAYPAWLRVFIAEARRRGAIPVLVTSPERRNFDAKGAIKPTLAAYAEAMRKVAREDGVALIDLQRRSIALYEYFEPERSPALFNDGGKDKTHHNNAGAWLLARGVAYEIAEHLPGLGAYLTDEARIDTGHPLIREIAPSLASSAIRPAGN